MDCFLNSRSASTYDYTKMNPCSNLCGMCPSCVFAKVPPVSMEHLWTVADSFQRRFLMDLLSRCRSIQVLEKMQRVLSVTSWTMFTYSRSNRLASPVPAIGTNLQGKPLGLNVHEIRAWFDDSPHWIQSHYLCRLLLRCDTELLRSLANLTSVLLIKQKRGLLNFDGCTVNEELEEPALVVVPGSSKSFSGISRYKDFISCLPVNLAKRILGLLNESSLRICEKVCRRWQLYAKETLSEIEFNRSFDEKIREMVKTKDDNIISPTYANIVKVPVPVSVSGDNSSGKEDTLKIKLVEMEERNVYCGGYYTTDVTDKRDPHRVVDFGGKTLMAVGSKDGVVQLLYVAVEARVISVLKSNVVPVQAVLLCEDKDMVITGNFDAKIRCWNVKTETCVMTLYGHTGPVNCLDVCEDTLVSGAKDSAVKVWSLQKGKQCEEYNFKHTGSVQCVKISTTTVYSSCDKGLVKIWNLENASVLRVINDHHSSVKCLFFNKWHLLTGDIKGLVMAWSTNCDAKECVKMFSHPKEVNSVTLTFLRVVTGCADGKIRIFNFLTGDCLRVITAAAKSNRILSVHFHESSIVASSIANVKRYHFHNFWDNADSASKDQKCVMTEGDFISDKSKLPSASAVMDHMTLVASPSGKVHSRRKALQNHTSSSARCLTQVGERDEWTKNSVKVASSEKATSERIKKRGPHHPPTRDSIRLKVNAIQKAQCMDEVSINMGRNAKLRDDWSPDPPSHRLNMEAPRGTSSQASKPSTQSPKRELKREVFTAPGRIMRPHPPLVEKTKSQSAKTHRVVITSSKNTNKDPEKLLARALLDLESCLKSTKNVTRMDPFKEQTEFQLLTTAQFEEYVKTQREHLAEKSHKEEKVVKRERKMKEGQCISFVKPGMV